MFIEGDNGIFDITPHKGVNEASFLIRVKDASKLDYEQMKGECTQQPARYHFCDSIVSLSNLGTMKPIPPSWITSRY